MHVHIICTSNRSSQSVPSSYQIVWWRNKSKVLAFVWVIRICLVLVQSDAYPTTYHLPCRYLFLLVPSTTLAVSMPLPLTTDPVFTYVSIIVSDERT